MIRTNPCSNQKGLSVVEVMVGLGLLGMVAYVGASFQASTFQIITQITNQASLGRAIASIQNDILSDHRFLPPIESLAAFETGAGDKRVILEQSFGQVDPLVLESRCYDSRGARLATMAPNTCYFRVSFYRVTLKDLSLPAASNIRRLPMSRINARLEYVEEQKPKKLYISRLVTDTLPF